MESAWDSFAVELIEKHQVIKYLPRQFNNEIDVIKRLAAVPDLCESFRSWLLALPNVRPDGSAKSNQFRERGNDIFKSKQNNHLALEAYSKAIFAAPKGSEALALGHANRAVLLNRFGRYQEAFDDCHLALAGGYPEASRLKIFFRQAECAQKLRDPQMLRAVIRDIEEVSVTRPLSGAEKVKLSQWQEALESMDPSSFDGSESLFKKSDDLPTLKEKIGTITGRYVVTVGEIKDNGIIARESAVSFVPVYDSLSRSTLPSFDCQKCAKVNVIPFPCATCGRACYCSSKCRQQHEALHRFECFGYRKHLWHLIGIAHLGIRSFLDGFGTILCEIRTRRNSAEAWFQELARECEGNRFAEYGRVFRLVTNFDQMKRDDLLHYSMAALMLAIYLRECTAFFPERCSPFTSMKQSELFVLSGSLILRHIGQLVCNGHAISELRAALPSAGDCLEEEGFHLKPGMLHRYFTSSRVFTGIFPRISMFNHSCDPNIRNSFEGSRLTVYATRPIDAGEEIFNCYGPNYKLMRSCDRYTHLRQQYCFVCNCSRCTAGDDDFYREVYHRLACPGCGKCFVMELVPEHLTGGFSCQVCGNKISCSWNATIVGIVESDEPYSKSLLQQCLSAYEECARLLIGNNQTKLDILHGIFDRFLPFAGLDEFCLDSLKKLAIEFVSIRRHQFGRISLEYIVGCFFLIDLLAIEHCSSGGFTVVKDRAICQMMTDFREALSIVGIENRTFILRYLEKYVKPSSEVNV
ncbi:SET and MYND domain-containing protein 4-like [Anopheles cruzii]|uniref:SET and MYND domain-containing protein 4-like n=1 Tax=Anopheles cruzii TaxID=68878 RepID=UPI0022EC7A99|nr:SET and MYND domain-containing protein 4-like [Anopheles cruzii]